MTILYPRLGDLRNCKIIQVIEIERGIGAGNEDNPYRVIREYYSFDGKLLARHATLVDEEKCCG